MVVGDENMGKTTYEKCKEIMEVVYANDVKFVTPGQITPLIRKIAGSNRETIKTYLRELREFGFLKATSNPGQFAVVQREEKQEPPPLKM